MKKPLRDYLWPRFPLADLPTMLGLCVVGSLIAGTYGILHDQVTYSIGPEYFTRFKFEQFAWADWGAGKSWPSAKRWQGSILVV